MPTTFTVPADTAPSVGSIDEVQRDLYGKDLMFTDDLKLGAGGDYLTWEVSEAVRQAIMRRLMVSPGEFAVRPDYGVGVPDYVKKRGNKATLDELRTKIIAQLGKEDRIQSVDVCTVTASTTSSVPGINIYIKCTILGTSAAFSFAFQE